MQCVRASHAVQALRKIYRSMFIFVIADATNVLYIHNEWRFILV